VNSQSFRSRLLDSLEFIPIPGFRFNDPFLTRTRVSRGCSCRVQRTRANTFRLRRPSTPRPFIYSTMSPGESLLTVARLQSATVWKVVKKSGRGTYILTLPRLGGAHRGSWGGPFPCKFSTLFGDQSPTARPQQAGNRGETRAKQASNKRPLVRHPVALARTVERRCLSSHAG
jgi:hypothetical protein